MKLDLTYIGDAARGTAMLYQAKGLKHSIYNIATGEPNSVGRAARLSQKHSHFPVPVEMGLGTLMERDEALDISRAQEKLLRTEGWPGGGDPALRRLGREEHRLVRASSLDRH